jgi:hypothetical protein
MLVRYNTGTLFYITNIICHFLSPGLLYKSAYAPAGIAMGIENGVD